MLNDKTDRKKELRKWFIDHPEVTIAKLGEAYGKSASTVVAFLYSLPSAPGPFVKLCQEKGIPDDLLPDPTRTKAELQAEIANLRAELAECRLAEIPNPTA